MIIGIVGGSMADHFGERGAQLLEAGVRFRSLTRIFEDVEEPI